MKKTLILLMLSAVLCIAGCDGAKTNTGIADGNDVVRESSVKSENNEDAGEPETVTDTVKEKKEIQEIKAAALRDKIKNRTEISRYTGDVDGDGTDEDVVLLTTAQRGADGKLVKDDGQEWLLYISDKQSCYVLFDDYVQLGDVYFEVSDYYKNDNAEPKITVVVSTGAGFSVTNFSYDKSGKYMGEVVYDTKNETDGGINRRFSSIPEI